METLLQEYKEDPGVWNKQEQKISKNSKVVLQVKKGLVELQIKLKAGSIEPGIYDVSFSCIQPGNSIVFAEALDVKEDGQGDFHAKIELEEGTYYGCQVLFETMVISFKPFTITRRPHDKGGAVRMLEPCC